MAELFDVYEPNGTQIGGIPISPQQRKQLHAGATITITFHTPRMLRHAVANASGSFDVFEADGRLTATDVEQVKRFIVLQADSERARAAGLEKPGDV